MFGAKLGVKPDAVKPRGLAKRFTFHVQLKWCLFGEKLNGGEVVDIFFCDFLVCVIGIVVIENLNKQYEPPLFLVSLQFWSQF